MSVSKIPSHALAPSQVAPAPQESPSSTEQQGYRLIETDLNFLKKSCTDEKASLRHSLESARTSVQCYFDSKTLANKFNLFEHGFQYIKLDKQGALALAINQYAEAKIKNTPSKRAAKLELSAQIVAFVSFLAKENNIPGTPVITDYQYRSSEVKSYRRMFQGRTYEPPLHFVHVDFNKEETTNLSSHIARDVCKPAAEKVFGKMLDSEYLKIKHHFQLNIWIPLHTEKSSNSLTVAEMRVEDQARKLQNCQVSPEAMGFSLHPSFDHKFITKENFTRNEDDPMILAFISTRTPHSAIIIPKNTPEDALESVPKDIPETIPECTPEDTSESSSEDIQEPPRISIEFRLDLMEKE